MTKEHIEWLKINKDIIIEILSELRAETLEQLSSAKPESFVGLQFFAEQIKGAMINIENISKVKKRKKKTDKEFTGI